MAKKRSKQQELRWLVPFKRLYHWLPRWSRFVIGLASTITAIIFLTNFTVDTYNNTFGQKAVAYKKISKLAADAQIDYFDSVLGQPIFKNKTDKYTEYIYVHKFMYVQALTNKDDKVVLYAVTTRTKDFNPEIVRAQYQYDPKAPNKIRASKIAVQLGKTTFSQLDTLYGQPEGVKSVVGARRYFYNEVYYLGNPGNYQDYIFGQNDAGVISAYPIPGLYLETGPFKPSTSTSTSFSDEFAKQYEANNKDLQKTMRENKELAEYRKTAIINTFAITSPNFSIDSKLGDVPIGADLDQVRVIDTLRAP